jgi:hypothetical protein
MRIFFLNWRKVGEQVTLNAARRVSQANAFYKYFIEKSREL